MWISEDGRRHTVSLPPLYPGREPLRQAVMDMTPAARDALTESLEDWWADESAAARPYDPVIEAGFVATPMPTSVLESLDMELLHRGLASAMLQRVDARWRLDVYALVDELLTSITM